MQLSNEWETFMQVKVSHVNVLYSAYLAAEDINFISVDWKKLSAAPRYFSASANVQRVGEQTGQLIKFLVEHGSDLNKFHLIGFSLGAHVTGIAGAAVNGSVARITGTIV